MFHSAGLNDTLTRRAIIVVLCCTQCKARLEEARCLAAFGCDCSITGRMLKLVVSPPESWRQVWTTMTDRLIKDKLEKKTVFRSWFTHLRTRRTVTLPVAVLLPQTNICRSSLHNSQSVSGTDSNRPNPLNQEQVVLVADKQPMRLWKSSWTHFYPWCHKKHTCSPINWLVTTTVWSLFVTTEGRKWQDERHQNKNTKKWRKKYWDNHTFTLLYQINPLVDADHN